MKQDEYKIGQIIYVLPKSKPDVLMPLQVVEEIRKRSLDGTSVSYMVNFRGKSIHIEDVHGEVFATAKAAKKILTERMVATIDNMVKNAEMSAEEWYRQSDDNQHVDEQASDEQQMEKPLKLNETK